MEELDAVLGFGGLVAGFLIRHFSGDRAEHRLGLLKRNLDWLSKLFGKAKDKV